MGNKLGSIFGGFFQDKEEGNGGKEVTESEVAVVQDDSIIQKLRKINQSLETSREILMSEKENYNPEEQAVLKSNIDQDVVKTTQNLGSIMQSLIQYMEIMKKRLYQHHLFKNDAYAYANELYQASFQARLWIPRSEKLIKQSQEQFLIHSQKIKEILSEMRLVLEAQQNDPMLIRPNKNYEWLLKRRAELESRLEEKNYQQSEREDRAQLNVVKEKLLDADQVTVKVQQIDYALLGAIYRNGKRFYESLYVQNTLNCLRAEMKQNYGQK